jgi:uncharacterized phiE125 gp8 family phage protein
MVRLEPKAASERRNYTFDWASYLGGTDTITTSDVSVEGVTLVADSNDTTSATVEVSGGTDGTVAKIINTITTADGHIETETFILPIETGEPVSVAEAKAHLRVVDDSEDALIASYLKAARGWVENYTSHILVRRQITEQRDRFCRYIEINNRPVISVNEISYTDSDGMDAVYADFIASTAREPTRIYPALNGTFPTLGTNGEVTVTYTAGYAQGEEPQALLQAILLLVGHWFAYREAVSADDVKEVPFAVVSLCGPYRAMFV